VDIIMKNAWFVPLLLATIATAQVPSAPTFIVHTVDGPLRPAPLAELAEDFALRTGGDKPKVLAAGVVVAIRHATAPLPSFLNQNVLVLTNGDRIPIVRDGPWKLEQDRLHFRPANPLHSPGMQLSVNYASVLCLGPTAMFDDQEEFVARLERETRLRDVILLMDGDRLEGALKNLDGKAGVSLEANSVETQVPLAKIRAIAFNTEFRARPRVKGPYAHVVLAGGGRLGLMQTRLDAANGVLSGKLLFGGPAVQLPLTDIRAIDVRQGPAVYLSDLPITFEQTPFFGLSWPLGKDRDPTGRPLRLGPDTFDKGLGMHSQSKATFRLDGKYHWFETVVGLDERQGRLGRVRLRVLLDDTEQDLASKEGNAAAAVRSGRDGPLHLRFNVRGAKQLTLGVEFADFGDVQGRVNWGDARLIK
jgi:hypothetical protein